MFPNKNAGAFWWYSSKLLVWSLNSHAAFSCQIIDHGGCILLYPYDKSRLIVYLPRYLVKRHIFQSQYIT